MDWLLQKPITHRGLHSNENGIPENSLPAFCESIKAGLPIELDVHMLSDGNIAVFHDDNLKRMTGIDAIIEEKNATTLRQFRLLGTDQNIPLFPEVLDMVNGIVPLVIEIKNRGKVGKLEEKLLVLLTSYRGMYAVHSFNPFSLQWFRKHAPDIVRGQISEDFKDDTLVLYKKVILRHLLMNRFSKPDYIAYKIRCLPFWRAEAMRRKGIPVIGWTVKTEADLKKARTYCDNIIFEGIRPELAVS